MARQSCSKLMRLRRRVPVRLGETSQIAVGRDRTAEVTEPSTLRESC